MLSLKHGIDPNLLINNLEYALLIIVPILCIYLFLPYNFFSKTKHLFMVSSLICTGIILTAGAKIGAWRHHLLPLVPIYTLINAELFNLYLDNKTILKKSNALNHKIFIAIIASFTISACILGVKGEYEMTTYLLKNDEIAQDIKNDIQNNILKQFDNKKIAMGYDSGFYQFSKLRPLLIFSGHPLFIDAPALMDMQLAGLKIPKATYDTINSCEIDIWLSPGTKGPLNVRSFVMTNNLFEDDLIQLFHERYEIKYKSNYFYLWFCKDLPK